MGPVDATIRAGSEADVEAVAAIYDVEVMGGHATFETEPSDRDVWWHKLTGQDPFLVAEVGGEVVGFAYAYPFRPRAAYHRTRETSVYLAPSGQGHGLGTRMYAELLTRLRVDGVHTVIAVIAQPNDASMRLHEKLGFEVTGTLREVGDKFDRLIDIALLQLML
ncbi:MAG: pat [Nocardioidaceae bacterium]|nr:pat [Nocardioidaceae bacterium]